MDDTATTLLVAERDESTRAFLLGSLAADGYELVGAQTEGETRVKSGNHGPAPVVLGGVGKGPAGPDTRLGAPAFPSFRAGRAGLEAVKVACRGWVTGSECASSPAPG